jgi:Leucine rich repeat
LLVKLNLGYNRLSTFADDFQRLGCLEQLNLKCNRITAIPDTVIALQKLQVLNLASNKIVEVNEVALAELSALQRLHLQGNPLKDASITAGTVDCLLSFWFTCAHIVLFCYVCVCVCVCVCVLCVLFVSVCTVYFCVSMLLLVCLQLCCIGLWTVVCVCVCVCVRVLFLPFRPSCVTIVFSVFFLLLLRFLFFYYYLLLLLRLLTLHHPLLPTDRHHHRTLMDRIRETHGATYTTTKAPALVTTVSFVKGEEAGDLAASTSCSSSAASSSSATSAATLSLSSPRSTSTSSLGVQPHSQQRPHANQLLRRRKSWTPSLTFDSVVRKVQQNDSRLNTLRLSDKGVGDEEMNSLGLGRTDVPLAPCAPLLCTSLSCVLVSHLG